MRKTPMLLVSLLAVTAHAQQEPEQDDAIALGLAEAQAALDGGEPARALAVLQALSNDTPEEADVVSLLAVTHEQLENKQAAQALHALAVSLAPEADHICQRALAFYAENGLFTEGCEVFGQLEYMGRSLFLGPLRRKHRTRRGRTTGTYDAIGRQETVVHPGGRGPHVIEDRVGWRGRVVSLAYYSDSRRQTLTDPDGGVVTYSFDDAGRLVSLVNAQGERTTLGYDPVGRRTTLAYASGSVATWTYDAASRITGVRNATSGGAAIVGFDYTLDDVGNPVGMALANGDAVTWSYDPVYRLTREQRDGANAYNVTYSYDPSGNRLTRVDSGAPTTFAYDPADRLLTTDDGAAVTTYTWDADGNNALVEAASGVTTMTWDGENRLRTIQLPGASVVTNTYAANGLRAKREDASGTVKSIWDGSRLLLEADASNVTQAAYTSSLGRYGATISQHRSGASSFLHPDHLGSIWALTNSAESVTDTYLLDAWGNVLAASGSTPNPFRYVGAQGYYTEPSLGLSYVRARWLRPGTGSWLSVDPVEGQGRYGYVGGRAVWAADASGQYSIPPGIGVGNDVGYTGPPRVEAVW